MASRPRPRRDEPFERFADALGEALGPLYRVSVVPASREDDGTLIPMPGADGLALLIQVDRGALRTAVAALQGLLGEEETGAGGGGPAGAFTHVERALEELITAAEASVGRAIEEMSRAEKQRVVRFLDERGAFAVRRSVETVAEALGVSRFTVYNYLESSRDRPPGDPG